MTYTIKVTNMDIRHGSPRSPKYCPVAQAICRELKLENVSVGTSFVIIYNNMPIIDKNRGETKVMLPTEVGIKIRQFDTGALIEPFEFELDYNAD